MLFIPVELWSGYHLTGLLRHPSGLGDIYPLRRVNHHIFTLSFLSLPLSASLPFIIIVAVVLFLAKVVVMTGPQIEAVRRIRRDFTFSDRSETL